MKVEIAINNDVPQLMITPENTLEDVALRYFRNINEPLIEDNIIIITGLFSE